MGEGYSAGCFFFGSQEDDGKIELARRTYTSTAGTLEVYHLHPAAASDRQ